MADAFGTFAPTAEVRSYNPTWRDRMARLLMGDAPPSPARQNFVGGLLGSTGLGQTGMGLVDATPAGIPLAAQESMQKGDMQGAAMAVVPFGAAKTLAGPIRRLPADPLFQRAVANTPGASIDDGMLRMMVSRNQKPEQELTDSVRGGVFYLPKGDANAKYYTGTKVNSSTQTYGGTQRIEGETGYAAPLFVKGATGGNAPKSALDAIKGKGAYDEMRREALLGIGQPEEKRVMYAQRFLEKHAPEMMNHAEHIVQNSYKGNQLPYALQEAAVASAVRAAGHDGVIGYSVRRGGSKEPFISEVFDTREKRYPSPSGQFETWEPAAFGFGPVK